MVVCYALRGSTGFGAAAAMPLLGLVIPLKVLIPAWTLVGLAASVTLFGRDLRHVAWRHLARLVPACLVGVLIGLYAFSRADPTTLARGLGALVLAYGVYSVWGTFAAPPKWQAPAGIAGPIAGFLGGSVGTTFGTMASLFFAIYFDTIRLAKDEFRATMTAILLALVILRGAGYLAVGQYTSDVLIAAAAGLPLMLAGIFVGNHFHAGMDERTFRRMVGAVLVISGIALLVK
jgi:uncharacterized membrane protein YfcA